MRPLTMPQQGVSTRMAVLLLPAMREGRFYKFWVYIMTSRTGTLYTGMTGFFDTRISQHKSGEIEGFTKKYKCDRLVYNDTATYMWQSGASCN
jgi:predicted GIY-YIG superfamily endonuclease